MIFLLENSESGARELDLSNARTRAMDSFKLESLDS